jgi:hypothetical protein
MAKLTVIDEASAPKRPSPGAAASQRRQAEYEAYVQALKKGQVGMLRPGPKETTRGVAVRVSRAGKRIDRAVETWAVDGIVYFKPV